MSCCASVVNGTGRHSPVKKSYVQSQWLPSSRIAPSGRGHDGLSRSVLKRRSANLTLDSVPASSTYIPLRHSQHIATIFFRPLSELHVRVPADVAFQMVKKIMTCINPRKVAVKYVNIFVNPVQVLSLASPAPHELQYQQLSQVYKSTSPILTICFAKLGFARNHRKS